MAVLSRVASLLGLMTVVLAGACFSPRQPSCAFSCVDDGRCPSGYSCDTDGICHRDDGVGVCDIPAVADASPDLADGHDAGHEAGQEDGPEADAGIDAN